MNSKTPDSVFSSLGELAASIGHELRNPLGVIDASVFLLRKRIGTEPELAAHLDRIASQVRISSQIIDDLLAIARDQPPRLEDVDVAQLLEQVLAAVPASPGVRVSLVLPPELPLLRADRGQLRQVLVNLLTNAVDAVGEEGRIQIECKLEGGELVLLVGDDGPGIDPALGDRIFAPLVTTKERGVGLGLSLCRRLIERAGGTVGLEPGPLPGATFAVRLPLEPAADPRPAGER